jgi:hypothetical protein
VVRGIAVDADRKQIYWTQKGPDNGGHGRISPAGIEFLMARLPARAVINWSQIVKNITRAKAIRKLLAAIGGIAGCVVCTGGANAQELMRPGSVFVQLGNAHSTNSVTGGLTWGWDRKWDLGSGQLTGFYEGFLSVWSYPDGPVEHHTQLAQIGLTPVFRWTPSHGESPWFFEGGIGLTLTSKLYEPTGKRFSTAFNFGDQIAVGRRFGAGRQQEISLRLQHFSNGAIKHPNPGENFYQVRYAYLFQ